jgi:hypothetical protein
MVNRRLEATPQIQLATGTGPTSPPLQSNVNLTHDQHRHRHQRL